jgi:hypothetical protein
MLSRKRDGRQHCQKPKKLDGEVEIKDSKQVVYRNPMLPGFL